MINQAYNVAMFAINDEHKQRDIINELCRLIPDIPITISPPALSRKIQDIVVKHTGIKDPYKEIKKLNFNSTLRFIPYLKTYKRASKYPLEEAVRIAIAGSTIDLGANPNYNIDAEINKLSSNNIALDDLPSFKKDIQNAETILYIADNLEESIFDKLLIEELLPKKIFYAVRSQPILNDITMEDIHKTGISSLCTTIESGSDIARTILSECTKEFKEIFETADLVIAK
jgi:damage-control phosphatase, subfamily I